MSFKFSVHLMLVTGDSFEIAINIRHVINHVTNKSANYPLR